MGCSSSSISNQVIENEIASQSQQQYKKRFTDMEYKYFGKSGLKVSALCFSSNNMGNNNLKQQEFTNIVKKAYRLGINFFETSESYQNGQKDILLGEAFKALQIPREELVISYTIRLEQSDQMKSNNYGHSRKQIIESVKSGLKRLQISHLDIVYCDRFDEDTPLEETIKAFNHLVKQGLILYWGASRWSVAQIFEARNICAQLKLAPPQISQVEYNMLYRDTFEQEYGRLFDKYKLNSTIWNPLCFEILNASNRSSKSLASNLKKINDQDKVAIVQYNNNIISEKNSNQVLNTINKLSVIANKLECSLSQLAMGWVLANQDATSALFSANKQQDIEEIVESIEVMKLITPEINTEIDSILSNLPISGFDFKTFSPKKGRREQKLASQNSNKTSIQT